MRSVSVTYRPLNGTWPGEPTSPLYQERARFKAGWSATLDLLDRELHHIGAKNIVIQLDLNESEIRNDGMPKANARPRSPGVVLAFDSPYGPLKYPCDQFDDWQDNARAIALALEALRKVDRYGVTKRGEQYTGWKALPATTHATLSVEGAAIELFNFSGVPTREILTDREHARRALRIAVSRTHPDRNKRNRTDYDRVDAARSVLTAHHGHEL